MKISSDKLSKMFFMLTHFLVIELVLSMISIIKSNY